QSFQHDSAGNLVGALAPLGDHVCLRYDATGNPTRITRYPVPGALGSDEPITQSYTYKAFPSRLETASDPRDPSRALARYAWDAKGNLVSTTNAVGDVTSYALAPWGLPEVITDPSGAVTEIEYDTATGTVLQTMVDATGSDPIVSFVERDSEG